MLMGNREKKQTIFVMRNDDCPIEPFHSIALFPDSNGIGMDVYIPVNMCCIALALG